jgi:hypothetical protein
MSLRRPIMFDWLKTGILAEIGAAIGNVGEVLERKRPRVNYYEEAYRKREASALHIHLPELDEADVPPSWSVITAEYRVLDEEEE